MIPNESVVDGRRKIRRQMLKQYVSLQKKIVDGEPGSASYRTWIHAFRQLGYALMNSGFEEDLDRLLRLRVLDGGRAERTPATCTRREDLHLVVLPEAQ